MALGSATFAGLRTIGGHMVMDCGAYPSRGVLVSDARTWAPTVADMVLTYPPNTVTFPKVRLSKPNYMMYQGVHAMRHLVEDQRWQWAEMGLSGSFNKRRADGEIHDDDKKTVGELFDEAFQQMGVTVDTSQAPDVGNIEVDWSDTNAAQALTMLELRSGARICPKHDGTFAVMAIGQGQGLPTSGPRNNAGNKFTPVKPKTLRVLCAPTVYNSILKLQTIGVEANGDWKHYLDLSYRPATGWGSESPESFAGIPNPSRALALATVYRYHQVFDYAGGVSSPPGFEGDISSIEQLILLGGSLHSGDDVLSKHPVSGRPGLTGIFLDGNLARLNTESVDTPYHGEWEINLEEARVRSCLPIYKLTFDQPDQASLYLEVSYNVRDDDGRIDAFAVEKDLGGTGTVTVRRNDLQRRVLQRYTAGSNQWNPTGVDDNKDDLKTELDQFLNVIERYYDDAEDVEFDGFQKVNPTGIISQVRFDWGYGGPAKTRASTLLVEFDYHSASSSDRLQWAQHGLLSVEV